MAKLLSLIREAEEWRLYHKQRGAQIEALAASIRLKALRDALKAVEQGDG